MEAFLQTLGLVSAALAFGGMVFFSAVVAPITFTKLDEANAAKFIRGIFPWFYLFVIATAGLGALALLTLLPWAALGLGIAAFGAAISRQGLMPRINGARDQSNEGDIEAGQRFERLHKLSVHINTIGLIGAAAAVIILGLNS